MIAYSFPKILIDGPFGAPAQDYKKYEVVLLVGLGIGATPMVSIVKDIINNMRHKEEDHEAADSSLSMSSSSHNRNRSSKFRTRKAYYYWVTREQGSFDWFKGMMNEVAEMDEKGVIELHNYCTSVYEEGDARSALIAMLQSLHHAKSGVDVVSGTRVKSHFAKPNWRQVYKRIALQHPNARVGPYFIHINSYFFFTLILLSLQNYLYHSSYLLYKNVYSLFMFLDFWLICRCLLLWCTSTDQGAEETGLRLLPQDIHEVRISQREFLTALINLEANIINMYTSRHPIM